jgi:hypothetical protein
MTMSEVSSEIFENSKKLFKESSNIIFYIKMLILFCIYLFSNYIFDRIDHEDLLRTFHDDPDITIKLPNNTTFKIIITLLMVITSHWVYKNLLKPIVYPKD